MIENDISEIANFFELAAKTPSFLIPHDIARVNIDDTCGAKVFDIDSLWSSKESDIKDKINDEGQ